MDLFHRSITPPYDPNLTSSYVDDSLQSNISLCHFSTPNEKNFDPSSPLWDTISHCSLSLTSWRCQSNIFQRLVSYRSHLVDCCLENCWVDSNPAFSSLWRESNEPCIDIACIRANPCAEWLSECTSSKSQYYWRRYKDSWKDNLLKEDHSRVFVLLYWQK